MVSSDGGRLLHVGTSVRFGKPKDDTLRLRSRPETFPAPYFLDTGDFAATATRMQQVEAYYRPGPFLVGHVARHGRDAVVQHARRVLQPGVAAAAAVRGRPGAWEIVARYSYSNLDAGTVRGGTFWRLTPMVNWYLSDHVRLEMAYGYGSLDRFGIVGRTQFFQSRLQLQL